MAKFDLSFVIIVPTFADSVSQFQIHTIWQLFKLQMRTIIEQDYRLFNSRTSKFS